ncbi:MAG: transposase [Lachnospiraceae bacterium]|nr:transposase [Lachnospiraceae bacterium]
MAKKPRKYDMEHKIQAVKLAKKLGGAKAAAELVIPENTMYAWTKTAREGILDIGSGPHTRNRHESYSGVDNAT